MGDQPKTSGWLNGWLLAAGYDEVETVVQSGDGRDVMTRPVGAMKDNSSLAFPVKDQPELWTR